MSDALKASETIAAAGATHPRVSVDDINADIMDEYYCSAAQAACADPMPALPRDNPLHALSICILLMRNGHVAVGTSKPASIENFDPEKGRAFAREDAIRQLWPLMGYALRDRLYREGAGIFETAAAARALTQASDGPKV